VDKRINISEKGEEKLRKIKEEIKWERRKKKGSTLRMQGNVYLIGRGRYEKQYMCGAYTRVYTYE
jgi:hypothetical protein